MKSRASRGFTLIELMIVVTIVAILMALATPAYDAYTRKAQRKEAMSALQGLAQAMERFYAQNNTYACSGSTCTTSGGAVPGAPIIFPQASPLDGTAKYDLKITAASNSSYTLEAQPIIGKGQEKDGKLQLKSTGERAWDKNADGSYSSSELTWSDY